MPDISQRPVDRGAQIDRLDGQFRHAGVVTGDLQQIVKQRLEPVQLTDQQFCRTAQRRIEIFAVLVDQVGGHPHRGQRRPQFMADVGGEPPLQVSELLQGVDLTLQTFGHIVERHGQPGHIVLTAYRHPLGEVAFGEPFGDPRCRPYRQHHLPRHQQRDTGQQQQQHQAAGGNGSAHQRDGALLAGEREDQI